MANTTYSSALDAVVLSTNGEATTSAGADCGHVRSQYTVPTSGDVVEAKIWLPGLSSAASFGGTSYPAGTLLDWASMWTDGADSTNGAENWPADTEVDGVETQYGTNYVSIHYGSVSSTGGSTGIWTTEPQGWEPAGAAYATGAAGVPNVQAGWNVVDIEFTSTVANIYYNGQLYVTVPAKRPDPPAGLPQLRHRRPERLRPGQPAVAVRTRNGRRPVREGLLVTAGFVPPHPVAETDGVMSRFEESAIITVATCLLWIKISNIK